MKTCTMCHKTKPLDEFTFHPRGKHGRSARCLECRRIESKNWAKKVKEVGHKLTPAPIDRFFNFVEKSNNPNGCWKWKGSVAMKMGYARFTFNGNPIYGHRYSYKIHIGEIPPKMLVLHHCDNPSCTNPKHLFVGTHKDNAKDMVNKMRQAFHGKNSRAILSEEAVLGIRHSYPRISRKILADKHNVTVLTIDNVLTRKTWRYI